jgi:hypothetical protein
MTTQLFNGATQHDLILNHLRSRDPKTGTRRTISQHEARDLYRIERLAARICELRDRGYMIIDERKRDVTGRAYARYSLVSHIGG